MHERHVVHLSIAKPVADVYAFLADPLNYPQWSAVVDGSLEQVGPLEWAADTAFGQRLIRFSPRNPWGVLDHAIYVEGQEPLVMPLRVIANEEGCDLIFTFFRRPGISDAEFASAIEWVRTDFLVLRGALEI